MANICRTEIKIQASREVIQDFIDRWESCVDGSYPNTKNDKPHIADEFGADAELFIDKVGSKWVKMYDGYDYGISEHDDTEGSSEVVFELESAWYPPSDMLKEIHRQLSEIDPDVNIRGTYWDETYDPIGAFKIYDTGEYVTLEDIPEVSEDEFEGEYYYDDVVSPIFERLKQKLGI